MPYIDGKRVSAEEWQERYGSIQKFHTGPHGENPASAPELDEETKAPKSEKKTKGSKAGGKRSPRSERAAKNAIADALGVKADNPTLADIDVSGLDAAPAGEPAKEDE